MRIAIVTDRLGFAGGLEAYALDVGRGLRARGHRVVLLHGPGEGRDPAPYAAGFDDVRPAGAPRAAADLDVAYVQRARRVEDLLPLGTVPLVIAAHDHDHTCVRTSRMLPLHHEPCHRAPGAACVAHGCVLVRDRRPDSTWPVRMVSPFALRRRLAALARRAPLIACSGYVADRLMDAGVPRARVHVVHPVPPEDPRPPAPRPASPRLAVVGQLVRGKGVDLAVSALGLLPAEVTLTIAGAGPDAEDLRALADRVAPGRVELTGWIASDHMHEVYDAASVVLVPSRWPEPFGMIGIEAMRRGRPVAAAAHGGIPEWLPDDRGGRRFAPGDAAALARAVAELLADPGAGARARTFALARFSHEATLDGVERVLAGTARQAQVA